LTHLLMTNVLVLVAALCVFHSLRPIPPPLKTQTPV
jgi:hypothetical protein